MSALDERRLQPLGEAEYRLIVETTSEGIWLLDQDARTTFVNEAMARGLGYSVEEMIGKSLFEFIPDAEHALAESNFAEVIGGLRGQLELRVPRKDGSFVWGLAAVSPIVDGTGNATGALGMVTDITERKQAERALRQAEERYRSLTENLPIVTYRAPLEGYRRASYISPQLEDMLGFTPQEWLDDVGLYGRLVHPDDRDRVLAELEAANASRGRFSSEYRIAARDGRYLWVHDESIPVAEDGTDLYALGYVIDITHRKEAERRLAAQHAVASVLAELPSIAEGGRRVLEAVCRSLDLEVGVLWRIDPTAELLRPVEVWHLPTVEVPAFEAMTRMLTFARNEGLPGMVWASRTPQWVALQEDDRLPRGPAALREGLRGAFGFPVTARSRVLGVIEFFSQEVGNSNAEVLQMMDVIGGQVGQFFARAEATEQLQESEARFRRLIETANDAFISIDRDSTILEWNRAAEKLFGWSRDEAVGLRLDETVIPSQHRTAHREGLERFLDTGEGPVLNRTLELTALNREGVEFPVEVTIWQATVGDGYRFYAFLRDIRKRRLLEDELRHAQKMEAVGRLAGGIAHDFNNLLLAIRGYGELALTSLAARDENGDVRESIEQLTKAADRGSALTGQLLAFSRKQMLQPATIDLNAVVVDLASLLRRVIGESVELAATLAPEPCWIEVDPTQIEQALMNMAINAKDAMAEHGRFTIETRRVRHREDKRIDGAVLPAGSYVEVALRDTGCGIDEQTRSRIFEPFFTTKEGGTGLGLSTVYGFVQQSKGHMFCISEPGAGTTFMIYLPEAARSAPASDDGPAPDGHASSPGSATILIAEDEGVVRRLLRQVLEQAGYVVLEAIDGDEAVELAETHRGAIDLLLTDLVMPGKNGRETAEAITERRPETAVIFLSGYADEPLVETMDGDEHFLQKPFPPGVLVERIRRILAARS